MKVPGRVSSGVVKVRSLDADDREWFVTTLTKTWGSVYVARKGELVDASQFPGHVALVEEHRVGLAIVAIRGSEYEVLSLSVTMPRRGIGRALLYRCFEEARSKKCERVWLTTTNDNVAAFAFYQQVGMNLCAFYRNGVSVARSLKPEIPLTGAEGIPIDHELEFELRL
ncbi:MAG TPA: GNAT family N-acetyltransferase [Actinomycetes bacterium]|nr:GNAT family N-acetyltransferase [Actinomycetes bacterium]